MKTVVALTVVVMIGLVSLAMHTPEIESENKIGVQVITALQEGSSEEFSKLFPTLADFHALMLKNSELYGKNLEEASRDFREEFVAVISPSFGNAFERIRGEGEKAGIDWSTARFLSAEVSGDPGYDYAVVPMTIHFSAGGRSHRLKIEKALVMDGRWKISQYIRVEE